VTKPPTTQLTMRQLRAEGGRGPAHPNQGKAAPWLAALLADPPPASAGCVVWPFAVDGRGYPSTKRYGRMVRVSRIVLTHFAGPPAPGRVAAHAPIDCHNPLCVSPHHLRWATVTENKRDQTLDNTDCRGARNPNTRLLPEQVLKIYSSTDPNPTLAARFGVSDKTISHIRHGRTWAWLTLHARSSAA
jgi:hypothetical protein